MNQMSKSNVTLWKNRDSADASKSQTLPRISSNLRKNDDSKQVEGEFIENLKKQIYFMVMIIMI